MFDDEDVKVKGFFFSFLNFLFVENTINKVFICKGCTFLFPLTCLFCSNKTKSLICLYSRLYCFLNFFSIERNMEERSQKNPYFLLLHYFVWCTMGETILDRTIFECRSTENVQFQIFNLNFYPLKITNMYFSNVLLLLMHDWFGQTWIPIKTRTNFSYLFEYKKEQRPLSNLITSKGHKRRYNFNLNFLKLFLAKISQLFEKFNISYELLNQL